MVITYHGGECFKVSFGDTTLAFNPPSKQSKLKSPSFAADIVFVSSNHSDFNGVSQVGRGGKEPFVISGPGEYEVAKTMVKGFAATTSHGGSDMLSTVYLIELEGMKLVFLGPIASKKLPSDAATAIEDVDILFVPVGGDGVLSASDAHDIAVELEPSVVIPMHYPEGASGIGKKDSLATFLKEEGSKNGAPTEKFTVKKKDLEGKEGDVVVLKS